MAYQNVPVSDGYQIVQQIVSFATNLGWTIHRDEDNPNDTRYRIATLSAGGIYITLNGYGTVVYINGHRGIDVSKDWNEQPDQYVYYDGDGDRDNDIDEQETMARVWTRVTPILSVHLFGSMTPQPYIYAAIEVEPGFYRHLVIGHFEKFGTSLGGTFWDVSGPYTTTWSSYPGRQHIPFIYNTQDNERYNKGGFDAQNANGDPAWVTFGNRTAPGYYVGGCWGCEVYSFFVGSPIQFNGRTPLLSPLVWVSTNGYRPYGTPPGFRYVSMEYFEAGDEFTIGTETWKVFPWARRKTGQRNTSYTSVADEATEMYGVAYLKA